MSDQPPISGKVQLDLTDFKSGVTELNRELRVVESSFKASAAGLGDWGKSADGLQMRMDTLTKSMELQKQKVENLKEQHRLIVEAYGADSRAAQEMQIKINQATESYNQMDVELGKTKTELDNFGKESQVTGDKVKDLGEKTKETGNQFDILKKIVSGIGEVVKVAAVAIAALAAAVVAVGVAIAGLVFSASKAAGELDDLSNKTGISTTKLQEMNYISNQLGVSHDTLSGSFAKLTRSIYTGAKDFADYNEKVSKLKKEGKSIADVTLGDMGSAFQKLGVKLKKVDGTFRDSEDVFSDVIKALGKIPDETLRDALAMQIFGKSAQELNPIIKAGSDELNRMAQEARDMGAVVSEEGVKALADFDDKTQGLKDGLSGIGMRIAASVVPAFTALIDKINSFMKSKDVQAFINDFAMSLKNLSERAAEIISNVDWSGIMTAFNNLKLILSDFKNGDWIKGIADIRIALTGLVPQEALDKIQDIAVKIGKVFGGINTADNEKPVSDLLLTLESMIEGWVSTIDWSGLITGFTAKQVELTNSIVTWANDPATQDASRTAGMVITSGIIDGVKGAFGGMWTYIDSDVKQGGITGGANLVESWAKLGVSWIDGMIQAMTGVNITQSLENWFVDQFGQIKGETIAKTLEADFSDWILQAIGTINPGLYAVELAKKFAEVLKNLPLLYQGLDKILGEGDSQVNKTGTDTSQAYLQGLKDGLPEITATGQQMTQALKTGVSTDAVSLLNSGALGASNYATGATTNTSVAQAGVTVSRNFVSAINSQVPDMASAGSQMTTAIRNGVLGNLGSARMAGQDAIGAALKGANSSVSEATSIGAALSDYIYIGLSNTWDNLKANVGNKIHELIEAIRNQLNIEDGAAAAAGIAANMGVSSAMTGANVNNQSENYAFYAPVTFQNQTNGSLAASIKVRRF
jgi:hypothetical protein